MPALLFRSSFLALADARRIKARRSHNACKGSRRSAAFTCSGGQLGISLTRSECIQEAATQSDGPDVEVRRNGLRLIHREAKHLMEPGQDESRGSLLPRHLNRQDLRDEIIEKREKYRDYVQGNIESLRRNPASWSCPGSPLAFCTSRSYSRQYEIERKDMSRLAPAEADQLDEDYRMQEYAKRELLDSTSNAEILMKAELLIEENWLGKIDALPGNIFCLGAFGDLFSESEETSAWLKTVTKLVGCAFLVLIQLLGPPLIFLSVMPYNIGVSSDEAYEWRCHPLIGWRGATESDLCCNSYNVPPNEVSMFLDWQHVATTKALGIVFSILFILNGIFTTFQEKKSWKKLYNTFRFLDDRTEKFKMTGWSFLTLGVVVNNWVVLWSCLDIFAICGASISPQDLLLDALGLLFMYNLDEIGGKMAFVSQDDWPALRIAWIYSEVVHKDPDFNEKQLVIASRGWFFAGIYNVTTITLCILVVLVPALQAFTPFLCIAPGSRKD